MKVAVVTCTVDRPELFALCEKYVARQTVAPDVRIVQTEKLPPFPNLARGLQRVPAGHHVVIMEDDDWYGPGHVENMLVELEEGKRMSSCYLTRRYNLPARRYFKEHQPTPGGAMMSIHAGYVQEYAEIVGKTYSGKYRGDRVAWERNPNLSPARPSTLVGIKGVGYGLPGLSGKTFKHSPTSGTVQKWMPDLDLTVLRGWVGDDADVYLDMLT